MFMDRRRFCNLNLGLIVGGMFGNSEKDFSNIYNNLYEEYCELSKREVLLNVICNIAKYTNNIHNLGYTKVTDEVKFMFPDRFKIEEQFFGNIGEEKERLWKGEMEIEIINSDEECKDYRKTEISVCDFLLGARVNYPSENLSRTGVLRKLFEDDKVINKIISAMVLGHGVLQFYLSGYGDNDSIYPGISGGWSGIHRESIEIRKENEEEFWQVIFSFRPRHSFYLDRAE